MYLLYIVIPAIVFCSYLIKNKKEIAFNTLFITSGIELIIASFGGLFDYLLAFVKLYILKDSDSKIIQNINIGTNYFQTFIGIVFIIIGIAYLNYLSKRVYILNTNTYHNITIEKEYKSLKLQKYEFKEEHINITELFRKINGKSDIQLVLDTLTNRIDEFKIKSNGSKVGYTAIASIPLMVFIGSLCKREIFSRYFEFNKFKESYYELEDAIEIFRKSQFLVKENETDSKEVIFCISLTSKISDKDIEQFGNISKVDLFVQKPKDNYITTKTQLNNYKKQIYEKIIEYSKKDYECIHIVYSGQSCLAFEIGKILDRQRMPKVIVYHYLRSANIKYPWGIVFNDNVDAIYLEKGSNAYV